MLCSVCSGGRPLVARGDLLSELGGSQQALDDAVQRLGLVFVAVFGSYARRRPEPGEDSDVDIAVLGCRRDRSLECLEALGAALPWAPLDLVRLEAIDPVFRQEIMDCAVLLSGDPDRFHAYRAFAYRDFVDSADLRALERTLFHRKLARIQEQLS